jgi:hypothetical protein
VIGRQANHTSKQEPSALSIWVGAHRWFIVVPVCRIRKCAKGCCALYGTGHVHTRRLAPKVESCPGRFHAQFRDQNRRDIGKSQSVWTDPTLETAGSNLLVRHQRRPLHPIVRALHIATLLRRRG